MKKVFFFQNNDYKKLDHKEHDPQFAKMFCKAYSLLIYLIIVKMKKRKKMELKKLCFG